MGEVIHVDFGLRDPVVENRNTEATGQAELQWLPLAEPEPSPLDDIQEIAAHCAAEDPDYTAWLDLHNPDQRFRFTAAVPEQRADILEEYPRDQMLQDIQRDYHLTAAGLQRAQQIARDDCHTRNQQFQDWQYGN